MTNATSVQKIILRISEAINPGPLDHVPRQVSEHAYKCAWQIRGRETSHAIIIHGIARRSGTNYLGELLCRHPQISYYPNRIWEFPFLGLTGDIHDLQQRFFLEYEHNRDLVAEDDFLPLFGASLLAYLYAYIPNDQHLLLKMPSVRHLPDFFYLFPNEKLIVNARDGRDVVASMVKTWPQIPFLLACRLWDIGARTVLNFNRRFLNQSNYLYSRYEDVYAQPEIFIRKVCDQFELDEQVYPYDQLKDVPLLGSSTTIDKGFSWSKKPADFQPIGRWRDWSAYKKAVFKLLAGKSLVNLGYAQDLRW